jgi:hypothetical protein
MTLSIIEPDGLHAAKALKRPGKTHGRILAAREQHEGTVEAIHGRVIL